MNTLQTNTGSSSRVANYINILLGVLESTTTSVWLGRSIFGASLVTFAVSTFFAFFA